MTAVVGIFVGYKLPKIRAAAQTVILPNIIVTDSIEILLAILAEFQHTVVIKDGFGNLMLILFQ